MTAAPTEASPADSPTAAPTHRPLVDLYKANKHFGTIDGQLLPSEGKALARLRADVGMVFQSFNLFAHETIRQSVCSAR